MSIALVQSTGKDAGSVSSTTMAFASNVTAGSAIIASSRLSSGTATMTCSDNVNAGNYAADKTFADATNGITLCVQSKLNAGAGATTVTFTPSATTTVRLIIDEFSGIATSSALDQTATGGPTGSTSPSTSSVTTTQANELLFALITTSNSFGGFTAGSGYTLDQTIASKFYSEYQVVSSTGSYVGNATITNDTWDAVLATYKAPTSTAYTLSIAELSVPIVYEAVNLVYSPHIPNRTLVVGTAIVPIIVSPAFADYAIGVSALAVPVVGENLNLIWSGANPIFSQYRLALLLPVGANGSVPTISSASAQSPFTYINGLKFDAQGRVVIP